MTDFPRLARSAAKADPQGPAPMTVTLEAASKFSTVMMDGICLVAAVGGGREWS